MTTIPGKLTVLSPARYRISVLGFPDEKMMDRMGGLVIESQELDPRTSKTITSLSGRLSDQAALFGALNVLYNMRLPLLTVEYLGEIGPNAENQLKDTR